MHVPVAVQTMGQRQANGRPTADATPPPIFGAANGARPAPPREARQPLSAPSRDVSETSETGGILGPECSGDERCEGFQTLTLELE